MMLFLVVGGAVCAGAAIALGLLAFELLGDAWRDWRRRRRG